ncbi:hypothetical protein BUALT_Bualt05G0059100 [Buddleja alternifolia]|uniref:Selenoprotein H n=1 Tax=Buddleja alternifolia TaxID=168488 RepID=A0AAV6XT29_9LAMI|nr:hypothetical protein BUALT_Bualt05G0059100 [Buddleja alternifolia]
MAPKRNRNGSATSLATTAAAAAATRATRSSTTRATRSATHRGSVALKPPVDNPEPRKKKAKTEQETASLQLLDGSKKTVIIEHCKQSGSALFKTKAVEVKNGVEKEAEDVNVVINPKKPRKGCFEIRLINGGDAFVSLVDLKKPFEALDELDVEKVVADIVDKIK